MLYLISASKESASRCNDSHGKRGLTWHSSSDIGCKYRNSSLSIQHFRAPRRKF